MVSMQCMQMVAPIIGPSRMARRGTTHTLLAVGGGDMDYGSGERPVKSD
jgi:hypothetical protein